MNARFKGKVALVTGGTGALGRAVSLAFLGEGAELVVTYREPRELDELRRIAGAQASALHAHTVDVTDIAALAEVVKRIVGEHKHLDIVVNTVGAYAGGLPLWETDGKTFEQMLTLNLRSGFAIARAVVPVMLQQQRGAILNIASRAAVDHAAGAAAYAASKAAAVAMIDSLAADLKGTGVRANSVLPTIIDTEANRKAMPNADFTQWPKPAEIAKIILFLCSDDASLIQGASIVV